MTDLELLKSHKEQMEKIYDLRDAFDDKLSNIKAQIVQSNGISDKLDARIYDHINATKYFTGTMIATISLCITILLAIITTVKTLEDNSLLNKNYSLLTQIQNDDRIILSKSR